jgi:selenocysteine lyase/cysteine desulfurase
MHPEFALSPDIRYLNHAAVAPWPRRAVAAVARFAEENGRRGAAGYPAWLATERRLRERLADLLGAPSPDDIALVKNTSEGLSILAQGLDWRPGDNVVGIAQEFPSNRIPWEALREQGVEYRALDLYPPAELTTIQRTAAGREGVRPVARRTSVVLGTIEGGGGGATGAVSGKAAGILALKDPETALDRLCDDRTRAVAVSSVQYARGERLDLERLATACRRRGILLFVDAIQSLGARPMDLRRIPADAVVADGHKWLLGPEGIAVLYVAPALRPRLRLRQFGWHMVAHPGDYDRHDWTPSPTATRFEPGSPNLLGIHALEASLSLLQEVGLDAVATAIEQRVDRLIDLLDQAGFEILTPRAPARRAGILTFRIPDPRFEPTTLWRALLARGVVCAPRGGGIRFSPHFYTDEAILDQAVAITQETFAGL